MKKETLLTVHNYAKQYKGKKKKGVTVAYIYRLINKRQLSTVNIDGVTFIKL